MDSMTQLASSLGVSTATVSKALNNKPGVSADRAEMIRQYAKKRGYRPSYMARSLLRGNSGMIGLCFRAGLTSQWYANVTQKIQQRCHERGLYLNLIVTKGDLEDDKKAFDFFRELRVGGVIVGPLWHLNEYNALRDWLVQHKAVVAFGVIEDVPINRAKLDLYAGAQMAVEHLASKGHRKIGFFGTPLSEMNNYILKTRHTGFCEKMRILGLDLRKEWIIPTIDGEHPCDGIMKMEKLLDTHFADDLPTAWFCQNDVFAAKLINILRKRNLSVPEDIAIVGFDNQPLAELTSPPLSSVGFNVDAYVDTIVEMVFEAMEMNPESNGASPFINAKTKTFLPELVIRESSGGTL